MKQPLALQGTQPRKSHLTKAEAFRTWARDLEQRARDSVKFLEAYDGPHDICLKLRKEMEPK